MNADRRDDGGPPAPLLYIGGAWREGRAATVTVIRNPATGLALAELSHASAEDLGEALASVERGFALWRRTPAAERANVLERAANLLAARVESVARLITLEQGKPLAEARAEVLGTAQTLKYSGAQATRITGRILPSAEPGAQWEIQPQPVGPCAMFSPWNMPLILAARKVGPALAAGCAAILKPSEEAPSAVAVMVECLRQAGLPADVLNLVYGVPSEVSATLIASPVIRKISLTGSVAVGRLIAGLAAPQFQRVTLELGGHAPVIVLDDVDVPPVALQCVAAKYRNAGQLCLAPTRFLIQSAVYERFVACFVAAAQRLKVGDGLRPDVDMGPLANERQLRSIEARVAAAVAEGATLLAGGAQVGDAGYFYAPTVLADLTPAMRILLDEPFGPVALMCRVASLDDALVQANRNSLGLAGYAFTHSAPAQRRIQCELEVGSLAVNNVRVSCAEAPFGGVKDSGIGYEGGDEGLDAYLTMRTTHRLA